jgi:hypothetical protein
MAILDDFTINYEQKTIRATPAISRTYSVNHLYSALQDTFDESSQMDDPVPMSAQTPVEYTLINGWFMDYTTTHSLSGGAIQTNGWSNTIFYITFDPSGYTNAELTDLYLEIEGQTTGATGTLLHYDNTEKRWWFRTSSTMSASWSSNTEAIVINGGTGAGTLSLSGKTGETIYSNIYTLGSIVENTQLYIQQGTSVLSPWWGTDQIDILVRVQEGGSFVNSANLTIFAREYGNSYDNFIISAPSGRNAVPLATSTDGFNTTATGTVTSYTGVTVNFAQGGEFLRDLDNGNGFRPYKVEVNCNGWLLSQVYEYLKYITQREYTADINENTQTVSGWTYLESSLSSAYTVVKSAPFGTFTGKFFGARGVYFTGLNSADIKNFSLIDNNNVTQDPPNLVGVQVTSVIAGDRVFVTKLSTAGGSIVTDQYTLSATPISGSYIFVNEAISGETPKSGKIRIYDASLSSETQYSFTGWAGSYFALSSSVTATQAYGSGDTAYIPIIDETVTATVAYKSIVQSTDIPVIIRVRRIGILPFEIEGTVGSNGLSVAAIRNPDSIVTESYE